jgi:hypothetical protein
VYTIAERSSAGGRRVFDWRLRERSLAPGGFVTFDSPTAVRGDREFWDLCNASEAQWLV